MDPRLLWLNFGPQIRDAVHFPWLCYRPRVMERYTVRNVAKTIRDQGKMFQNTYGQACLAMIRTLGMFRIIIEGWNAATMGSGSTAASSVSNAVF